MKFKLSDGKGSVSDFQHNGVNYHPGDIVDLPQTYEGEKWLIRVDPVPEVVAPPQKITPVKEPVKVRSKPKSESLPESPPSAPTETTDTTVTSTDANSI